MPYTGRAMTALAFDTLKAAKALREAGFEEAQAEAVVSTVSSAINENVASKDDLARVEASLENKIEQVRTELKTEIEQVRTELKNDIEALRSDMNARFESVDARFESLEQRMTLKLGAMIAAAAGFIVVVDKLL